MDIEKIFNLRPYTYTARGVSAVYILKRIVKI